MYSILIWNDFIFANTFISETSAKTVAMGLKDYVGAFGNVDWGSTFAAIAISILQPLIIYFALNKWVTAGMTMGAIVITVFLAKGNTIWINVRNGEHPSTIAASINSFGTNS